MNARRIPLLSAAGALPPLHAPCQRSSHDDEGSCSTRRLRCLRLACALHFGNVRTVRWTSILVGLAAFGCGHRSTEVADAHTEVADAHVDGEVDAPNAKRCVGTDKPLRVELTWRGDADLDLH